MSDKVHFTASLTWTSLNNYFLPSVITEDTLKKIHYHHLNLTEVYGFWDGVSTAMTNVMATFEVLYHMPFEKIIPKYCA